jgi:hypothetical protein
MSVLFALLLIPLCSVLNHLGGQSTIIPNSRIVCRVFGIPLAFAACAVFGGVSDIQGLLLFLAAIVGMALWAVPGWGSGFCCIPPYNDTRETGKLESFVNAIMGVSTLTKLSPAQAHKWGIVFFILRGLYMLPMFCALAGFLTPWAVTIGLGSALMGIVYGTSSLVLYAEWKYGALVGAMLAGVLLLGG